MKKLFVATFYCWQPQAMQVKKLLLIRVKK